jgi:hypothetical protein
LAQVVVGFNGQIYQVTLHTGHNNDPGAFNISKVRAYVEDHNIKLWLMEVFFPEMQTMGLFVAYQLAARKLSNSHDE